MKDSAVSRDECKIIVNKKHAVQLLWSNTGLLAIRNKSSVLNIHSTGTDEALISRCTSATLLSSGNECSWHFRNPRGLSSNSAGIRNDR